MLLALAGAFAADYRGDLEDALLARALGDHATAVTGLQFVVRNGAAEDASRAWALYWLGTSLIEAGDPEGAREALRECIRVGPARAACMEQLGRLQVQAQAIRAVPTVWGFDREHGIAQAWTQSDRGTLRVEEIDGDPALVWTTQHDEWAPGALLFAVEGARPAPRTFHARVRSRGRDGWFAVVFVDARGADHVQPPIHLPADQEVTVDLPLGSARVVASGAALDPASLSLVILHDVTALTDASGGPSTFVFDDVGLL